MQDLRHARLGSRERLGARIRRDLRREQILGAIFSSRCQTTRLPSNVFRRQREANSFLRTSIHPTGGARRDRTDDLLLAKQALSQLSYGPEVGAAGSWWAWEDLNFRPHAYQARALTN